jgi:predicted metal-dependent HD superfamily phosphohydrolase
VLEILRDRWEAVWTKLGTRLVPQHVFDDLIKAYSSPDRFYHTLAHIENCLSIFDQTRYLAAHPEEVELAIWFHDAVYDTRRSDNEQRSAEWARAVIVSLEMNHNIADRVSNFILATRHTKEAIDKDAQLMVDVDLSILGREEAVFWRHEENIRKEYAWVPEHLFRQTRVEILSRFLDRPSIYSHKEYQARFERKARTNLKQAIARLEERSSAP